MLSEQLHAEAMLALLKGVVAGSGTSLSERPLGLKSLPPLPPPIGSVVREFLNTCQQKCRARLGWVYVYTSAYCCHEQHWRALPRGLPQYLLEAQELDDGQRHLHGTHSAPDHANNRTNVQCRSQEQQTTQHNTYSRDPGQHLIR
jgi:hypothetical protein